MNSSKWYLKHESLIIDGVFFISCFFYPISLLYLAIVKKSLKRHLPYLFYFLLTLLVIYFDPRKSAAGKEGISGFIIALSCDISFLMYVFSKKSELPRLRNKMILKFKDKKAILILNLLLEAIIIQGLTFLIVTGIWPAKGYDLVWSNPNWQAYMRCFLAILLIGMSIKLVWEENKTPGADSID